jgi:hypothetical protein
LDGTDFTWSTMDGTIFAGVDLAKAKGLERISH